MLLIVFVSGCASESDRAEVGTQSLVGNQEAASGEELNFTNIHELLVDSRGQMYVLDDPHQVVVLSPEGALVHRIGRRGAGPGEFRAIVSADVGAGDTLYVFDGDLSRMSVFEPGTPNLSTSIYLREQFPFFPYTVSRTDRGNFIAVYRRAYGHETGRDEGEAQFDIVRLLGPDGGLLRDSLLLLREQQFIDISYGSGGATYRYPFGRRTIVRVARDGRIYTAWTDSARFDVYSPDGEPIGSIEAPERIIPRPITAAERDSLVNAYSPDGQHAPLLRRALDRLGHRTWPVLEEFILDDRGRVWYAPVPPREAATNTWTALDERGRARERLVLPVNASLRAIRGSRAYVTQTDSLDVPRVVVYDIRSEATRRNE